MDNFSGGFKPRNNIFTKESAMAILISLEIIHNVDLDHYRNKIESNDSLYKFVNYGKDNWTLESELEVIIDKDILDEIIENENK